MFASSVSATWPRLKQAGRLSRFYDWSSRESTCRRRPWRAERQETARRPATPRTGDVHDARRRRTQQTHEGHLLGRRRVRFLDDLLQSLGCKPRPEKHGYAYELAGRPATHVHVKLKHLGVGFPPELRKEVDALNVVPSIQQRHAWLTYQPGVCDREELEGLLLRACDIATASQPRQALPRGRAARPGVASAGSDDQADLALILAVVRAYSEHASVTGRASGIKVIREAIFFVWSSRACPAGANTRSLSRTHRRHARNERPDNARGSSSSTCCRSRSSSVVCCRTSRPMSKRCAQSSTRRPIA